MLAGRLAVSVKQNKETMIVNKEDKRLEGRR
jgi:hypothetical protein